MRTVGDRGVHAKDGGCACLEGGTYISEGSNIYDWERGRVCLGGVHTQKGGCVCFEGRIHLGGEAHTPWGLITPRGWACTHGRRACKPGMKACMYRGSVHA